MITVIKNIENDLNVFDSVKAPPFAIYSGETLKRCQIGSPNHVYITDLDKLILMVLNKYHVLTSKLITMALENLGLENADQQDIKSRLKILMEGDYITRLQFEMPNGCAYTKCYSLGYRGRGYLKAIGQSVKLTVYINGLDNVQCKKLLAANQYLICTKAEYDDIRCCAAVFVEGKADKKHKLIFRPQAMINGQRTVIVEGVRGDDGKFSAICEKLNRMERTLRAKGHNIPVKDPEVVLVCESVDMMRRLMQTLSRTRYHLDIKFTADALIFRDPQNCLYRLESRPSFWSLLLGA